jgi:hypothetical protein
MANVLENYYSGIEDSFVPLLDAVVATIMALGVSLSTEPPSDVFAPFINSEFSDTVSDFVPVVFSLTSKRRAFVILNLLVQITRTPPGIDWHRYSI